MEENTNVTGGAVSGADNETDNSNTQGQATGGTSAEETPKTYTAQELQAETDRRVTEALKKANAKAQEEFNNKIQEAKARWEKESKMTAAEKEKAVQEKAQKEFEKERAEYKRDKLEFEVTKQLAEKKLPVGLAKMITSMGEEAVADNMKVVETMLSE